MLWNYGANFMNSVIAIMAFIGGLLASRFILRPRIKALFEHLRLRRYPDYNRELSNAELGWADDVTGQLYSEVAGQSKFKSLAMILLIIAFLVLMVFSMLAMCGIFVWLLKSFHQDINPAALSWYRIETIGGAGIIGLILGIFMAAWLLLVPALRSENPAWHFNVYFHKYYQNTRDYWKSETLDLVRKREVSTYAPADTDKILRAPFKRFARVYRNGAVGLLGLASIFMIFDLNQKTIYYPDHIEHSPYWSLTSKNYSLHDIFSVERTCYIKVRGEHQRHPTATLKYNLMMSDGRKVPLFGGDEGASLDQQLQAAEHWHEIVPAAKFTPIEISSSHPKDMAPTKAQCASLARHNCDRAHDQTLMSLFDLRD